MVLIALSRNSIRRSPSILSALFGKQVRSQYAYSNVLTDLMVGVLLLISSPILLRRSSDE